MTFELTQLTVNWTAYHIGCTQTMPHTYRCAITSLYPTYLLSTDVIEFTELEFNSYEKSPNYE